MTKQEVIEYAEYTLKAAKYKCDTLEEAEDISQDVLLAMMLAIESGKIIENPKGWISSVLNNKHADFLRKKYNSPVTYINVDIEVKTQETSEKLEEIIKSEEYLDVRKQIANLVKIYREVIVRYYIKNQKIKEIAADLEIPENTVKSRLDVGRKHVQKGINMNNEKYVNQSMEPDDLWISIAGREGNNGEPFVYINDNKIAMNILVLAYEKPLEISQISEKLGIACAYIEPIINNLIKAELMKQKSNKVYTDFIIFNHRDIFKTYDLEKQISEDISKRVSDIIKKHFDSIDKTLISRLNTKQYYSLYSYFAVRSLVDSTCIVRDELTEKVPFEMYPDRPNGGKWYAFGYHYPAGYNYENDKKKKYNISGESGNGLNSKDDINSITLLDYDTYLGHTHRYWNKLSDRQASIEFMKMMYICGIGDEEELFQKYGVTIDVKIMENVQVLVDGGFLTEDKKINIPVLTENEFNNIMDIKNECRDELAESFSRIYKKIYIEGKVDVPSHLTSVAEFQQYLWGSSLPMMILLKAREEGWLFDCVEGDIPAVIMIEK